MPKAKVNIAHLLPTATEKMVRMVDEQIEMHRAAIKRLGLQRAELLAGELTRPDRGFKAEIFDPRQGKVVKLRGRKA